MIGRQGFVQAFVETEGRAPAESGFDGSARDGHPSSNLQAKYDAFRADQRRNQALELARWIQDQAQEHYRADGPVDHWATLEETLARNGDDCDGLELLVYNFLPPWLLLLPVLVLAV